MYSCAENTCDATPAAPAPWTSPDAGMCCDAAITSKESLTDIADRRLLSAIAAGSRSAMRLLHAEYFSRLVKFFTHLLPASTPEVVDDLIADTLFDVWCRSANFASDSSVHVAIMRLAWAHANEHLASSEAGQPASEPLRRTRSWQTRLPVRTEAEELTAELFAALPPMGRVVVHLVYSGHSRQQVADIVNTSRASVDAHLSSWMSARAGVWSQVTRT